MSIQINYINAITKKFTYYFQHLKRCNFYFKLNNTTNLQINKSINQ